jgi:hypothetical protein
MKKVEIGGAPLLYGNMLKKLVAAVLPRGAAYRRVKEEHRVTNAYEPLGVERKEAVPRLFEAAVRLNDAFITRPLDQVAHLPVIGVYSYRQPLFAGRAGLLIEIYGCIIRYGKVTQIVMHFGAPLF